MKKSKSSHRWLKEHFNDPFVKQAQKEGYRARSAYKLLEIQEKDKLIKSGFTVIDLGAAPGGWTQVAVNLVGPQGLVIASDILPIEPIAGAVCLQGDFTDNEVYEALKTLLAGRLVDVVLSDMAPNFSGIKGVDQPKSMLLVELALDFAKENLKKGGCFLAKVFQGEGFSELMTECRAHFSTVRIRKPEASRNRSAEIYLLGLGFKG